MAYDYDVNPFIVVWEVTRACALKCLHCRAEAQHHRDVRELNTEEGKRLLDQIQAMDSPLFVFTGGDPLMREDFFELAEYAKKIGLRTSMTPSATPRVTEEAMRRAAEIGLDRWAFSLDGSCAEIHDRFRGTSGSFDVTMRSLATLKKLGMPLQINTTVSVHNKDDLPRIAELLTDMGVVMWSVFFLVPTGRGRESDMISAKEAEEVLNWLADLSGKVPFGVKTTAAPFYRRVLAQRARAAGTSGAAMKAAGQMLGVPEYASLTGRGGEGLQALSAESAKGGPVGRPAAGEMRGGHHPTAGAEVPFGDTGKKAMRAPKGVTDGSGFLFISHVGEVSPSGFLPLECGNVRDTPLAEIYREHPIFTDIRSPDRYEGKCGVCEFRSMCGGSRARAYSLTGSYMGSDPACAYQPPAWLELQAAGR